MGPVTTVINEGTHIPLIWFITGLFAVIGGVGWLTFIAYQSNSNSNSIAELKKWILSEAENMEADMESLTAHFDAEIEKLRQDDRNQWNQITSLREENYKLLMTIREDVAVIKSKLETDRRG